jgi:hypothetical protein
VLGAFPDQFLIEVEVDPTDLVQWRLFIDYNPFDNNNLVDNGTVAADPGAPDAGIRQVPMVASSRPDPSRCHVIEGLVALAFPGPDPHSFDPGTGDSIVWFYSPNGDLSGCPVYDAGIDGAFQDVGPDTLPIIGDGGPE